MYLVTGGAGFIGSHTVAALLERGTPVRVLDDLSTGSRANLAGLDAELVVGSITDPGAVAAAVAGCTHVIHLAAWPGVPASCADPVGFDHVNVNGTVTVFQQARLAGVKRVVYASSCAIYGSVGGDAPRREDWPARPESPYAASKAADELYAASFTHTLGLECVGLRYFNVFGSRQDPRGPYAAVIPRFVEFALRGEPLTVFGDGGHSRDFVSVADVARANILASTAPAAPGRAYNIGTGRATTVLELAHYVLKTVETTSDIAHHPERPGDIRQMLSDPSAAARDLDWRAEADFDAAMAETIDWYRSLA
jgi:UDP-glucose 4-epimerase